MIFIRERKQSMKKTIKRVLTGLLTAGVIFACSASVFAAPKFEKLPTLVYSELDGLMKQQAAKYVRKDNVVPMLWQGFLEMPVAEGRTAKLYVPQNTPQGAMFVVMNVPAGMDAGTFMETSGWKNKADVISSSIFIRICSASFVRRSYSFISSGLIFLLINIS